MAVENKQGLCGIFHKVSAHMMVGSHGANLELIKMWINVEPENACKIIAAEVGLYLFDGV